MSNKDFLFLLLLVPVEIFLMAAGLLTGKDLSLFNEELDRMQKCGV